MNALPMLERCFERQWAGARETRRLHELEDVSYLTSLRYPLPAEAEGQYHERLVVLWADCWPLGHPLGSARQWLSVKEDVFA